VCAERRRVELLRPVKGSLFSKQVPPPSLGWPFHGDAGGAGWCVPRERLELSRPSRAPGFGSGASSVSPPRRDAPNVPGCAEGGEHDSQRVTPSNRIANGPGAPVRFTLREGRRGCVSPAQLRVQESNLGGLESESRWDAGNPTRIVFTRRWPESNRHSPKAPLCRRMVDRSPTASWILRAPGRSRTDDLPFTRGALCTN